MRRSRGSIPGPSVDVIAANSLKQLREVATMLILIAFLGTAIDLWIAVPVAKMDFLASEVIVARHLFDCLRAPHFMPSCSSHRG